MVHLHFISLRFEITGSTVCFDGFQMKMNVLPHLVSVDKLTVEIAWAVSSVLVQLVCYLMLYLWDVLVKWTYIIFIILIMP